MKYKSIVNDDKDTIIITIEDGNYQGTLFKVGNISFTENEEIEFDFELPSDKKNLYEDENFCQEVSNIVKDIVIKSINTVWNEQTAILMKELEDKVIKAFKVYNYLPDEGSSFIEMFGKKGYVITEDDNNNLIAINISNNKTYYFDKPEQLAFLKKELSGTGIILN